MKLLPVNLIAAGDNSADHILQNIQKFIHAGSQHRNFILCLHRHSLGQISSIIMYIFNHSVDYLGNLLNRHHDNAVRNYQNQNRRDNQDRNHRHDQCIGALHFPLKIRLAFRKLRIRKLQQIVHAVSDGIIQHAEVIGNQIISTLLVSLPAHLYDGVHVGVKADKPRLQRIVNSPRLLRGNLRPICLHGFPHMRPALQNIIRAFIHSPQQLGVHMGIHVHVHIKIILINAMNQIDLLHLIVHDILTAL